MRSTNLWKRPLSAGDKALLVVAAFTAGLVGGLIRFALGLDRLGFWFTSLLHAAFVGLAVLAVGLVLLRRR
ncbi:hypothetical protein GA0070624_4194 [Micromonospora rhizosphaerae]|uniref:Uncharacterized protein n=1 Tax=Micromonospora rhizosphaerae TaxID=568872 RepID=A0A1C6SNT3_9ACTN|nr:hypothetical protein [Micromonospora rhizosphaerae]SCL31052.1 hypothetical protein GA0070624_4194 [Micromonospora rhizosphaerae]